MDRRVACSDTGASFGERWTGRSGRGAVLRRGARVVGGGVGRHPGLAGHPRAAEGAELGDELLGEVVADPAVALLPARRELTDASRWYEEQREGLGDEFRAWVDAAMAAIGRTPLAWPRVRRDAGKRVVRRFPYAVTYLVEPQHIEVLAVFHTSRDPKQWQGGGS